MPKVSVMPVKYGGVPFTEAIAFLRNKADVPTEAWNDLLGTPHAKAFTVAGANKMAIVEDFHASINDMITNGKTIGDFRRDFDAIVQKHGWSYKGKRGWRTRIIYNTNMRAAHMSGKWEQFQRSKQNRPYLQYLTVGDGRVREEHRKWHDPANNIYTILKMDDPFWDTHYPPNGWGCRCTVRTLSDRQLKQKNLNVSDSPEIKQNPEGKLEGIDTGFDYNVGKAWLAPDTIFGERVMELTKEVRTPVLNKAAKTFTKPSDKAFKTFMQQQINKRDTEIGTTNNYIKTAGFLSGNTTNQLEKINITPISAVITLRDREAMHLVRDSNASKNKTRGHSGKPHSIPDEQALELPGILRTPDAVLFDTNNKTLLYIRKLSDREYLKIILNLNRHTKLNHNNERINRQVGNYINSAGVVQKENLQEKRYNLLEGSL